MNTPDIPSLRWRKSSRSGDTGGACVEVASRRPEVAVRDSKDPHGPKFVLAPSGWHELMREIKDGKHDLA
jgi:hypothetical protein